jgi:L-glutamine-phosphate cytidylyltransferase
MNDTPTKSVIVAAGRGRRLGPHTADVPKCLVPVAGRPILLRQLDAFRACGVTPAVIVRGYRAEVLAARAGELGPVRFVDNREWETNNILLSLFHAEAELDGPFLLTYADIVFTPGVVRRLLDAPGDICLVVDRRFRDVYDGRSEHPLGEAEVTAVGPDGRVRAVGKRACSPGEAVGEFIGLCRFSAAGARRFVAAWREVRGRLADDQPFGRARTLRDAFLTDLLQHLIDGGEPVTPVYIDGEWREIDTVQDLERAEKIVEQL